MTKKQGWTSINAILIAICFGTLCEADILDFTEVMNGIQGSDTIELSNATVTSLGNDSFVFHPGDFGVAESGFSALNGVISLADSEILFDDAISDLSFYSDGHQNGDFAVATIYSGPTELASLTINGNITIDFSGFSEITRLFIDDSSSFFSGGMSYHRFEFETVSVPEPGSVAFMVMLLAATAMRRRRTL